MFTFTNIVYATTGGATSDLAAVKFVFGGATITPVAYDNTARTVSYLISVDGGKEYSISQTNFDWPSFQYGYQGGSNSYCWFFDGECGWTSNAYTQQVHHLSFDGFHNDPIEVVAKKQGTAQAPDDGLLLKTGDTLEIALKPENILTNSSIAWQTRQLQSNGSLTSWTSYGSGVKLDTVTTQGGIYQLKAIVTEGTDQHEYVYVRKRDEPYGPGKRGDPDAFGIAGADVQIAIRNTAKVDLGITTYAPWVRGCPYAPPLVPGVPKCNFFVADMCDAAGAPVPKINNPAHFCSQRRPPVANQWGGILPATITGWTLLSTSDDPQPGFVVVEIHPGGSGHAGLVDYDGRWISAGYKIPKVHRYCGFDNYQPARMRKYEPEP